MKICRTRGRTTSIFSLLATLLASVPDGARAQDVRPLTAPQHRDENGEQATRSTSAVALTLIYTSDANSDVAGGSRRGAAYLQRLGGIVDADLHRLVGWRGAALHASVQAIEGTGLSASRVDNLLTVSGIEAAPALRLFNLWVEQKLGATRSIRVGQFTAGQEFAIAPTANFFVNATFGWPGSFATDLPGGGPAYPVAVPGARFASTSSSGRATIRAALFAANPPDPDRRGLAGWQFRGNPLAIAEFVCSAGGDDPAWTFIIGGWWNFARTADLWSPLRSSHNGNRAAYVIADARLRSNLHGFARVTISPGDRNAVSRYIDAGVTAKGLLAGRPNDVVGVALAVARLSPALRRPQPGGLGAAASGELAVEASYQVAVGRNVALQPNLQWIVHPISPNALTWPGAGIRRKNALVLGLRSSMRL
ncbi:porin [Sphingomonas trueperi]|uniref:carbohydrate porin n=1 Tax=Sphingomonas trueperi TaxID=53317 RepID=UPI003393943C